MHACFSLFNIQVDVWALGVSAIEMAEVGNIIWSFLLKLYSCSFNLLVL